MLGGSDTQIGQTRLLRVLDLEQTRSIPSLLKGFCDHNCDVLTLVQNSIVLQHQIGLPGSVLPIRLEKAKARSVLPRDDIENTVARQRIRSRDLPDMSTHNRT